MQKHYIVRYINFRHRILLYRERKIKQKKEQKVRLDQRGHAIIMFSQSNQNLNPFSLVCTCSILVTSLPRTFETLHHIFLALKCHKKWLWPRDFPQTLLLMLLSSNDLLSSIYWFIKWQTSGASSDNELQQATTNSTTSDNEWYS